MSESLLSEEAEAVEVAPQAEPVAEAPKADKGEASSPSRPEWLPEKYKSPEELAKAYKELEGKFGKKEEDLRKKVLEELNAEAYKDRPATAGEYELPDFVIEEEALQSDLLKWWADHSYENGFSQSEFEKGIEIYMKSMPTGPDLTQERGKLGDNANQRIEAASMFATKFFPAETMPAIERLCESAEGIVALEIMMEAMKDGSFSGAANPATGSSEADLKAMMKDERYWNVAKRDEAFVKQVEAGFKKIYG
jgi:hypothetical protein